MKVWSLDWIVAASAGRLVHKPRGIDIHARSVSGVSIDSRSLETGEAFIALRGERSDGHAYLGDAIARGASCVIVERDAAAEGLPESIPVVRVHDGRQALTRLAAAHRTLLAGTKVIAVTGSNGKTTAVRFIDAALRVALNGSASAKSLNNDLGVPLTILRAKPGDNYLVCEVGMNAPGEIAPLARLVEPDIGVITSVGRAHFEAFGSLEGIGREKASLLEFLRPGGWAIVNTACESYLGEVVATVPNLLRVGEAPVSDIRISRVAHTEHGPQTRLSFETHTTDGERRFEVPSPGAHNAVNAALAIGVARLLGVSDDDIARGLANAVPPEMRMQRWTIHGVEVFNDAYNASPESTAAAVRTFCELSRNAPRRFVVFGDMLELGDHSPDAHREVGDLLVDAGDGAFGATVDHVVCVGQHALFTAERILRDWSDDRISMFSDSKEPSATAIARLFQPGDAVLLKGSRGTALERVEQALRNLADNRPPSADRMTRHLSGGRPDPLASAG
jgi:UDP-N-acetylmuramoyl-tripeptide--D-alanyl-D-alanine ligase